MTAGKTKALIRWTFLDKVMSLLLNMLSRLVITVLSRSKHLLISWLQSPSSVILKPKKLKSDTVSPSISHEVMGLDVYPENSAAQRHFHELSDKLDSLVDQYQGEHGPLFSDGSKTDRWSWVDTPWPWQKNGNMSK